MYTNQAGYKCNTCKFGATFASMVKTSLSEKVIASECNCGPTTWENWIKDEALMFWQYLRFRILACRIQGISFVKASSSLSWIRIYVIINCVVMVMVPMELERSDNFEKSQNSHNSGRLLKRTVCLLHMTNRCRWISGNCFAIVIRRSPVRM